MLAACSKIDSPEIDPVVYDIVTYESTSADASVSTFSYQVNDDSPVIILSANWKAPESLKEGTRLLLGYTTATPGQSGPIELRSVALIPGGDATVTDQIPPSESLQLRALWRTGNFLNLNSVINVSGQASEVTLYVSEQTLGDALPQAYIVVGEGNGPVGSEVNKALYASWNIDRVWSQPSVTALEVNYTDIAGRNRSVTISKN